MSVCTFIAADWPLPEFEPAEDYPLHIDLDAGTSYDGDADDNYCLLRFDEVNCYTDKGYGVALEWAYYTEGRAKRIIDLVKTVLQHTDSVEIWRIWLDSETRPIIKSASVAIADLKPEDIQEIDRQEVWDKSPVNFVKDQPTFYCLKITN